jgi:uncharacterized protein (TIGR02444 family)
MSVSEPTAQETPFWRFSVGFYSQPGVAPACLQLQDEAGVDVNLLMYLLWSASRGRSIAAAEVGALDARVAEWRNMAVIPLRSVRRALKVSAPLVAPESAERFRTRVKSVELEAERLQQEAMYALDDSVRCTPAAQPDAAARANLAAYESISAQPFPSGVVDALLAAFDIFLPGIAPGERRRERA